jgi:endonuclease VIII
VHRAPLRERGIHHLSDGGAYGGSSMPEGDIRHAAAVLRSALVDRTMLRFEAPRLVGITPRAGRLIESVEGHGKHLDVQWDDGIVLHTHMRLSGSWHLHRHDENWARPHHHLRALIEVEGWRAVCFNAPVVETYRLPDPSRHPGLRGIGPDLARTDADLARCVELLRAYDDPDATLGAVLLDQRIFCGVGNVFRCEVLHAGQLSPFANVSALPEADTVRLVNVAATLVRSHLTGRAPALAVYGRAGQPCRRCRETLEARPAGGRVLYWCPGCQVRFDPRRDALDDTQWLDDPHPAARRFLRDLPWRRTG